MKKMNYPLSATFIDEISADIESNNWDKKTWIKDLKAMKSVGIDTIIFIRGGLGNYCIYPSKTFNSFYDEENDFLGYMLEEAEKLGINAYIGLYLHSGNWDNGDYKKMTEYNQIFIKEIMERYGHHKNFIGWYIPTEVCMIEFNIIETINSVGTMLRKFTPNKKLYWCPLFRTRILVPIENEFTYEQTFDVWDKIFSSLTVKIDSISFQDGTAPLEKLEGYLDATKRAAEKHGIEHWANVELFNRVRPNFFAPVQFEVLKRKLEINKKYCTKLNCFEFSHFMSPHSTYESGRRLFKRYKKQYK